MKIKDLWRGVAKLRQEALLPYGWVIGIITFFCPLAVMAAEKVCFAPHIGLPRTWQPPTIDGFIEPEQAPIFATNPTLVETGWTRAPRVTYLSTGSKPMVSFQSLRHASDDYIYMGFMVHYDPTFDDEDAIVLVFRPQYAVGGSPVSTKSADERRIDIRPVKVGVGVDPTKSLADPNGMKNNDATSTPVRFNGPPESADYYRWDTSSSPNKWVQLNKTLAGGMNEIKSSEFTDNIKVRSYNGGANNRNWFVEVKLPTNKVKGGKGWIDLSNNFGFYFNVLRVCRASLASECTTHGEPPGSGVTGNFITEYTWPRANYTTGDRLIDDPTETRALVDFPIPPFWLGEAVLGGGLSDCRGVHFDGGHSAIGTQNPTNPMGPLRNTIQKNTNNIFEARVVNDGTVSAPDVTAEFLFAGWGSQNPSLGAWTPIPGTPSNPTAPRTVPVGTSPPVRFTATWNRGNPTQFYNHNCVAVRLNSTQDVFFSESQWWNNLDFVPLSWREQEAVISAKGYPNPTSGTHQDFLFLASETTLQSNGRYVGWNGKWADGEFVDPAVLDKLIKAGNQDGPVIERAAAVEKQQIPPPLNPMMAEIFSRWIAAGVEQSTTIWEVNSYRQTHFTLAIGGKKFRLYEPATGFGLIGEHEGETRFFSGTLSGPGVVPVGQNGHAWRKQVKNGEEERIHTRIEASSLPSIVCGCFQSIFGRCGSQRVNASPLSEDKFAGLFVIVGMVGIGLFVHRRSGR